MFRNIQANLIESIIALLILALCGWQTIKTFGLLYPNALSGRSSEFSPIKIEKSFIINASSNENSACLGFLEGVFERTLENASYSLRGELYLAFDDKILPTKVDLEASFNVLGQLAATVLKVNNAISNITLGLLNVDPIEITLLTSSEGIPAKREKLGIPGPILLKEIGGEFILDYPPAGKKLDLSLEAYPIEALLDLKINSVNSAKSQCLSGAKSSLDLIQLSTRLRSKLQAIVPQLPLGNIMDMTR